MTDFKILFSVSPWLLLLLIPAFFFTFFHYFRISKKFRRTRNRVISMIFHLLIMTLCVVVLSGMHFSYQVPYADNEVVLLVDCTYSSTEAELSGVRDAHVKTVLTSVDGNCRVAVVKFGYDRVLAVGFTADVEEAYRSYLDSPSPDGTGTDIEAALSYAKTLFSGGSGKIVLITDGAETDGSALNIVKSIAADGIRIDTVYYNAYQPADVELVSFTPPDYNIVVGTEFNLDLGVVSSVSGDAVVTFTDNGEEQTAVSVSLKEGTQTVSLSHTFAVPGFHEFVFEIAIEGDLQPVNNAYRAYIYLQSFDKILIVEKDAGESDKIQELIEVNSEKSYDVSVINASDTAKLPQTTDELREYDQVILVNIANSDVPEEFMIALNSYVHDYGGGLFTVGGSNDIVDGQMIPHAYNRDDLYVREGDNTVATLYQEMLPVQAINYTPPIGVMIIIDRSSSMASTVVGSNGQTRLDKAKEGAKAALNVLTERDWCGVMTLSDSYTEEIEMVPIPRKAEVVAAIDRIEIGGGTVYTSAVKRAGLALGNVTTVERRHILIVTDGEPGDALSDYGQAIYDNYVNHSITCSIISVGENANDDDLQTAVNLAGGEAAGSRYIEVDDARDLPLKMREDLSVAELKEISYGEAFTLQIEKYNSIVSGLTQSDMPQLTGYYGTKLKDGAEVILSGSFVPIYAFWKYGKGSVGSFMCDLEGLWSTDFIQSESGKTLLNNIVKSLFPTEDISPHDIEVEMKEGNYRTQLNIFTEMEEGQTVEVWIESPPSEGNEGGTQIVCPSGTTGYSRVDFEIRQTGVHTVTVYKKDADGNIVSSYTTYKTFSYSAEYDSFTDAEACRAFVAELAEKGNGQDLTAGGSVLDGLKRYSSSGWDPRIAFIITAIVLFLLDIAIRKFKFKWIHEIVRDRKEKKSANEKQMRKNANGNQE